jgi:hypothetical protein
MYSHPSILASIARGVERGVGTTRKATGVDGMRRVWCGQNTVPATLQTAPHPYYGSMSMEKLEATMVSEAEAALDLIKHGDDEEAHQ